MDEIEPGARRYRIGELAALSGVTRRALRLYEARGLLGEPERTQSGYRLYGPSEVVRAIRIRRLRELGLSLEQVGEVIAAGPELEALAFVQEDLRRRADVLSRAADEVARLLAESDERVWAGLVAVAERSADSDSTEIESIAAQSDASATLASLLADDGWKERWEPLGERLHDLRNADPDDSSVVALAREIAKIMPRDLLPDEAAPPARLQLFLGRRFGAAQVRCLHLARTPTRNLMSQS